MTFWFCPFRLIHRTHLNTLTKQLIFAVTVSNRLPNSPNPNNINMAIRRSQELVNKAKCDVCLGFALELSSFFMSRLTESSWVEMRQGSKRCIPFLLPFCDEA